MALRRLLAGGAADEELTEARGGDGGGQRAQPRGADAVVVADQDPRPPAALRDGAAELDGWSSARAVMGSNGLDAWCSSANRVSDETSYGDAEGSPGRLTGCMAGQAIL